MQQKEALKASKISSETSFGGFSFLPIARLKTTYSAYRRSEGVKAEELSPLPLRVVPSGEFFEIIDGFKRFETWQLAGVSQIPVVIEPHGSRAVHKRLLLSANTPRRTITPLDEACIVDSLIREDGLTMAGVASLLGHKKEWVAQRIALMNKLSPKAQEYLGQGKMGPATALRLTTLSPDDQDKILATFIRHPLRHAERLALIESYRIGEPAEQRRLLDNPLGTLRPKSSPAFSPRFHEIEQCLVTLTQALHDVRTVDIPDDLPPAEQRRLEALNRAFRQELNLTINDITKEKTHDSIQRPEPGNPPENFRTGRTRRQPKNSSASRDLPKTGSPASRTTTGTDRPEQKARPVSDDHRTEGQEWPDGDKDFAGDSNPGLRRGQDDSGAAGEPVTSAFLPGDPPKGAAPLRDPSRQGDAGRLVAREGSYRGPDDKDSCPRNRERQLPETVLQHLP